MNGWKLIESAPKDEAVLVYWLDGRIPCMVSAMRSDAPKYTGWWTYGCQPLHKPTHWMPLPPPPKTP